MKETQQVLAKRVEQKLLARIEAERLRKDKLQQEIADAMGVPMSSVTRWKQQKTSPSLQHFIAYAASVGYRIVLVDEWYSEAYL